jgi:hypothetical protein
MTPLLEASEVRITAKIQFDPNTKLPDTYPYIWGQRSSSCPVPHPTITRILGVHPSSSSPKFRFPGTPETCSTNSPTQSDSKPLEGYQLQTISGHQGQTNVSTNQGYAETNKAGLCIIPSHREGNNNLLRNNGQRTFPRISNDSMETCQPSPSRHERYQGPALLCCPLL